MNAASLSTARKLVIGCGYLGRRVADEWVRQGHDVCALTRSHERAQEFRAADVTPILGDVTDPRSLGSLPDVETVLYAVGYDRGSGKTQRDVYVGGLRNALVALSGRRARFLYISSTSVYGQNDGEWVDESSPCEPVLANGIICLEAEEIVKRWTAEQLAKAVDDSNKRSPDVVVNVLRLAGLYGPARLLRRVEEVKSGRPVPGNPRAWLNLIHVEDAVQAVLACEIKGEPDAVYLVADDRPVTRQTYYETLSSLIGGPPPRFDANGDTPRARDLNKRCRNRRLRDELGVSLRFPTIQTGLPDALRVEG